MLNLQGFVDSRRKGHRQCSSDPANIHAMCEDYRAAASIDLEHDRSDLDKKIACPLLALWGQKSPLNRPYDVLALWRERVSNVTCKALPGGHMLQEDVPDQFVAEVRSFVRARRGPRPSDRKRLDNTV